ncbi:MATA-HMG [Gigaspora margarita]|uniref:MATA-HMG n=1 Tax=Gigaspora margarita TaxID=4874 RepID=A0A8H4EHM5_GIGMA|nr:MATA-HMG [Gigaspora margarita]
MSEASRIKMPNVREIKQFNIDELANISKGNRYLNAFFIYRKEFTKRAISGGIKMRMTEISKLASQAWKNEDAKIKKAYTDISKRIEKRKQKERNYQIIFDENMTKVQTVMPNAPNSPTFDQLDNSPNSDTSFLYPYYEEISLDTDPFYESLIVDQIFDYSLEFPWVWQ